MKQSGLQAKRNCVSERESDSAQRRGSHQFNHSRQLSQLCFDEFLDLLDGLVGCILHSPLRASP